MDEKLISSAPAPSVQALVDRALLKHLARVSDEISYLWWDYQVWRTFNSIAVANETTRNSFFALWVGELYYQRAALAIRAMTDRGKDTYSLTNLLEAIKASAKNSSLAVDPGAIDADLAALNSAAAEVRLYVNKVLAHRDKVVADADEPPGVPIPGAEVVDAAVELLGNSVVKYTLLLRNVDLELRSIPAFNWISVFREPWLKA